MKNTIIAIVLLFFISSCQNTSTGQTPEPVKLAFQKKYPNENDSDWRIDKNGNFESHFKKDGIKYRADFKPDGSWVETETSIKKKDLPKVIREKIKADYDEDKIVEIEKVDHHSKGIFYDVEFKIKGKKKDVEFNESGLVIN